MLPFVCVCVTDFVMFQMEELVCTHQTDFQMYLILARPLQSPKIPSLPLLFSASVQSPAVIPDQGSSYEIWVGFFCLS